MDKTQKSVEYSKGDDEYNKRKPKWQTDLPRMEDWTKIWAVKTSLKLAGMACPRILRGNAGL